MSKPWQPYARHIVDTIAKIRRISARGNLLADEVLYDATLRNLQTLFEATHHFPDELRALYPDIPWKQISGFRNILVHSYLGEIGAQTAQGVVDRYLPPLEIAITALLGQVPR